MSKGLLIKEEIEKCYNTFIELLYNLSLQAIPVKRETCERFWWDAELSQLKSSSYTAH